MMKVLINGINGKMGKQVANLVLENKSMHLLGGLDYKEIQNLPYPIFTDINSIFEKPDVIIDFSIPESSINLLPFCIKNKIPIVIATTGFSSEQSNKIQEVSKEIPIFQSSNMSFEIGLMNKIITQIVKELPNSEIEIIETHHNKKLDSPSGTALMLADTINRTNSNSYTYNFTRQQKREKRNPKEIGFSSIRGGGIIGEHTVLFFNEDETLEIKHTAYSRKIYAEGALKAAEFIVTKCFGYYNTL